MDDNNKNDDLKPDDLGTVAGNFINAMKSWQQAGRPVVSKTIWNERLAICRGC